MVSDVKKAGASELAPENYSKFWMFYFLFSIAWIGSVAAYGLCLPCLLIGKLYRPIWRFGGICLAKGVNTLMQIQPWFNFEMYGVSLPAWKNNRADYVTYSNHRSHLDMFILLTLIPNIRVITKSALYKVPFLNIMLWALGNFPVVKRDKDSYLLAMKNVEQAIRNGDPVHLFPEMTRCETGYPSVQEFHLAPFHTVIKTNVPLIPLVFTGTDDVWPKGVFGLAMGKKITLTQLPAIHPKDFKSAEQLRDKAHTVMKEFLQTENRKR